MAAANKKLLLKSYISEYVELGVFFIVFTGFDVGSFVIKISVLK
jgi:hypothetical protein